MREIGARVGALAAIVMLLGGCAADTATPTASQRLQSTRSPRAASARSYEGTTSQGLPISFTVTPASVEDVVFGWRARCADRQVHTNTIALGGTLIRHGRFSVSGLLTTGGRARVIGRLSGGRVSGRLSRWAGSAFNTDCVARGIGWRAHVLPGSVPAV